MGLEEINDIERLRRINAALVQRVERSTDQSQNAFSLFQTAIHLEGQVRRRTDELSSTLRTLERSNADLAVQKEISERASSLKTRFLAAASHDLLQPLHAAQLSLSALADLQGDEKGRRLVDQVERSLDTMNELLRTLLDISRLDAGAVEPSFSPVAIAPVAEALLSDFRPLAESKGIRLRARIEPLTIRSDRMLLRQILLNLIANAVRYTAKGGVLVSVRRRAGHVAIDILDTGCGIPEDEHERVFEEFHRVTASTVSDGEVAGLGLGLSIVRRLVDALRHRLELASRVGRGTRFRLWIDGPVEDAAAPAEVPIGAGALQRLDGLRVLLIENDPAVSEAMTELMTPWGCSLRTATTATGAAQVLDRADWAPDLIVADQHLDGGDLGTEAITEVRRLCRRTVPAIVATADPGEATVVRAAHLGAHLLLKPVKPAQLRALVAHLVSAAPSTPQGVPVSCEEREKRDWA